MNRFHTFLLTLFLDEQDPHSLRGRIRSIATDREVAFARLEELLEFVRGEAKENLSAEQRSESSSKKETE